VDGDGGSLALRNVGILPHHYTTQKSFYGTLHISLMGTRGFFLGVKRPGREADHSRPSSAEVKNTWIYTSTPPVRLHGVVLI
jgi:hypothetical protein